MDMSSEIGFVLDNSKRSKSVANYRVIGLALLYFNNNFQLHLSMHHCIVLDIKWKEVDVSAQQGKEWTRIEAEVVVVVIIV